MDYTTLTLKINKNLVNIIQSYLLPSSVIIKYNKNIYIISLYDNICLIKHRLDSNGCFDSDSNWYTDLNNSRIVRFDKIFWTIRKQIINKEN